MKKTFVFVSDSLEVVIDLPALHACQAKESSCHCSANHGEARHFDLVLVVDVVTQKNNVLPFRAVSIEEVQLTLDLFTQTCDAFKQFFLCAVDELT